MGYLEVLTGFLITGYYAVVSGWCLQYVYASIMGELHGDPTFVAEYFKEFSADPVRPVMWTVVIFLICHFVIIHGVRGGIEKASKIMMPVLFILLLIIVVAACLLPNAGKGVEFLLKPDFSKVDNGVFLGALGQSFYSLSIGMGCICTYASYFSRQTNLFKTALQISVIDFMVAILAGLMIFPAAFSVGVSPDSGPSLIFITLPNVFNEAFAAVPVLGWMISLLFYVLLSLAALTSLMSLHEVNTSFFYEELKIGRKSGALIVTVSCAVIGAFCSLSLGATDALTFASILDGYTYLYVLAVSLDRRLAHLESSITQTEAERISHILLESIEVAIAHVDVFFMIAEVYARDIALSPAFHILIGVHIILLGEVGSRRMICRCNRPSHGQFARWIHLSCQDVGHRVTAFNTGLPCHEDGIHTVAPTCCFHNRS